MSRIKTKNSTTAASVPANGSLLQGEVAINIADKKLFVGNSSGNPIEITNQGVTSVFGSVSGIYVTQATGSTTIGLDPDVFVSGSLHVSGVLTNSLAAMNIFASEDPTTSESRMINMRSYGNNYAEINVADDGALILKSQANFVNINPSGTSAVYLDTASSTGYLYITPTDIRIGGSSAVTTIPGSLNVAGYVSAGQFDGPLDGAVYKACKNTDSITLRKGDPVFIAGTVGATDVIEVQLSRSDTAAKMPAVGLLTQSLIANATGYVTILGALTGVDTSAFAVGNSVYIASTGWLTAVRPTGASILVQNIGRVGRVNSNNGEILVMGPGRTNDVPNNILASGTLTLGTPDIITPLAGTGTVFNTNAIAINMGGAASQLSFGAASSTSTFKGSINATGAIFNNGPISTTGYVSAASGYRLTSSAVNAQTGTTYTLLSTDDGRIITMNNGSSITVTVPTGLNIGFNTTVIQLGAGQVTFATGVGSPTLNSYGSALKITGQYGAASIISYASNSYNLAGTLTT